MVIDDDGGEEDVVNTSTGSTKRSKPNVNPVVEVIEILNETNDVVEVVGEASTSKKRQKTLKRKQQKYITKNVTQQTSNQPIAFDYAKVDFGRFQGGSHNSPTGESTKSKYNGKVSNKLLCLIKIVLWVKLLPL